MMLRTHQVRKLRHHLTSLADTPYGADCKPAKGAALCDAAAGNHVRRICWSWMLTPP
jgi:hypothetical protein